MERNEVQQLIDQSIANNANKNMFGVSNIAAHTHNNTDSLPIDPNDLINASLYFAVRQVTLTSAQILTLHTTPVTLIPALGNTSSATAPNTIIIVEGITAKIYAGANAYTGANNLEFRYTNASGIKVTADIANTFINSASNAYAHVAGIITTFTPVSYSPIIVCVPTADPGAGNGNIVVSVKYRVISL